MSYQREIVRSLAEMDYWRNYEQKGFTHMDMALLTMEYNADLYEQFIESEEDLEGKSAIVAYEWYPRFFRGYHDTKTGLHTYTKPKPRRYASLMERLSDVYPYLHIYLCDHLADHEQAIHIAEQRGYDRFADQRRLSAYFRGFFLGSSVMSGTRTIIILSIHFIPNEQYFRVRKYCFEEHLKGHYTINEHRTVDDHWFATGTNYGRLFLEDGISGKDDSLASNYSTFEKGRRVSEFDLTEGDNVVRMRLCRSAKDIDYLRTLITD